MTDFLYSEEGTIPRSKILTVGTMLLLMTMFYYPEAFAKHGSHSSHGSHGSHGSHSSHVSSSHTSHGSSLHTNSTHSNTSSAHSSHASHASAIHSSSFDSSSALHQNSFTGIKTNNIDIGAPRTEALEAAEFTSVRSDIPMPPEVQPNTFLKDVEIVSLSSAYPDFFKE